MSIPKPEHGEKNTYKLPRGEPLRRAMRDVYREQRRAIIGYLRAGTKDDHDLLPLGWPPWHDFGLGSIDIAKRTTPLLTLTWEAAVDKFAPRVGLDPNEWNVINPHTEQAIQDAALAFSDSTNATTSLALDDALARTRAALHEGVIEQGEALPALTKRVNAIFDGAEKWKARSIAQTETSRAVHAAQEAAAIASGVVTGWEWLLSADACPKCVAVAARARFVRLGQPFVVVGKNPHYSSCRFPPIHPHDNCSVVEILDTDEQPTWHDTLHDPEPATDAEVDAVARQIGERDEATQARKPPKPAPAVKPPAKPKPPKKPKPSRPVKPPKPPAVAKPIPALKPNPIPPAKPKPAWEWGTPIAVDKPVAERIKLAASAQERVKELTKIEGLGNADARMGAIGKELIPAENALRNAKTPAERARLEARIDELRAEAKAIKELRERVAANAPKQARAVLGLPAGVRRFDWGVNTSGLTTDTGREAVKAAREWLPGLTATGAGKVNRAAPISFESIPADQTQRAECTHWENKVRLPQQPLYRTAVHEWGHQMEESIPGVRAATEEFLKHRVGSEPPRKMRDINPLGMYRDDEEGREDDFKKAFGDAAGYVGKHYHNASEIISMGVEKLYADPGHFARQDPEYCTFIVGILDGSLRKP